MKLSDKQAGKLRKHLEETTQGNEKCPICKNTELGVVNHVFELRESTQGAIRYKTGKAFPVCPVVCTQCGHVSFFNPLVAGVMTTEDFSKSKNKKDGEK